MIGFGPCGFHDWLRLAIRGLHGGFAEARIESGLVAVRRVDVKFKIVSDLEQRHAARVIQTAAMSHCCFLNCSDAEFPRFFVRIGTISSAAAMKKVVPQPVGWLTRTEMKALLGIPDRQAPRGRLEHALILFLYNTGARVFEATVLAVRDV